METKKTKLTISGKPKKNLYEKKGLTNNKNKQKFVTEKNSLNLLIKTILDFQNFQRNLFLVNRLFHLRQENHLSHQK